MKTTLIKNTIHIFLFEERKKEDYEDKDWHQEAVFHSKSCVGGVDISVTK